MGLYSNWDYANVGHLPAGADLAAWPNSVGGRIMNAVGAANVSSLVGMSSVVAEFQNIGWVWDPSVAGRSELSGKSLLDRQIAGRGECGWLATALHILLKTPAPYGFGQPGSEFRVYSGLAGADPAPAIQGDGFVAHHAGLHHALPANIALYDPLHNPVPLENLYRWGDHVVVEFAVAGNTYFWDPSYNTRFNQITDMASHRITQTQIVMQGAHPNMNFRLNNNRWLRLRTGAENNYNPHSVFLLSTNNNPVPLPAAVVHPPPHNMFPNCCNIL